jgi:hypothetical protein
MGCTNFNWRLLKNSCRCSNRARGLLAIFWYIIGVLWLGRFGAIKTQHKHSNGAALDVGCLFGVGCVMN